MFGSKKKIEKRKISYERFASELLNKMDRVDNSELRDKIGEVYDSVSAMSLTLTDLNSGQDKRVRAKLKQILGINDKTYLDVKPRFEKDCAAVINLLAGAEIGYKLTFSEKMAQKKRLAGAKKKEQMDEAMENAQRLGAEMLELDSQIEACNARIRKEKDEAKAVLILRERKKLERLLFQKKDLKEKNDRIVTMAADEEYIAQLRTINEGFDLKRLTATAREAERLAADQALNDRLYNELRAMTDKSMGVGSGSISDAELAELRAVRKEVVAKAKEKVYDRSEDVLTEIEEEYEDELEPEDLV